MKAKHQNTLRYSPPETVVPSHDQISTRAELLWREMGQPKSRDEEIWLEAERQLLGTPTTPRRLGNAGPEERMDELDAVYPDPSRSKETTSL